MRAERVDVMTKSFKYFEDVEPAFAEAIYEVPAGVLFLHPDCLRPDNRPIQAMIVEYLTLEYPTVGVRFSTGKSPLTWDAG